MTSGERPLRGHGLCTVAGMAWFLVSRSAGAQAMDPPETPPPPPPAAAEKPPEAAPLPPAPRAAPAPAPAPAPPPLPPEVGPGTLLTPGTGVPLTEAAPPAPLPNAPPEAKWYENLKLGAFADAYYAYNFNQPHPEAYLGLAGGNYLRAYDLHQGFSLHWAGVDAVYAYQSVGATVGLRFGPSTVVYNPYDAVFGAEFIKQAYASWKPLGIEGPLTLDFGKYDQPFGSEVADSQLNLNYTRSLLYWLAQPLHFTGLRIDYAVAPWFDVKLFVVNGWNRVADNNAMKDLGAQVMLKPMDQATFYLGYMLGAEQPDTTVEPPLAPGDSPTITRDSSANQRFRHLVDFVADINPTPNLRLLLNADYGTEELTDGVTATWYGANLAIGIKPVDEFLIAPRGEVYLDDSFTFGAGVKRTLYSGTLTLGYLPLPNLIIKLDGRGDFADDALFPSTTPGHVNQQQLTVTLGMVATTN
jgi:hypothetical protein